MDAATKPLQVVPLQALGDPLGLVCEGDFCEIPEHHTQAVINRKLDEDAV
jgi:hypothetical protein